jgi:hypothetical protein
LRRILFPPAGDRDLLLGIATAMVWEGVAILSSLNLCVCTMYAFSLGTWWLWSLPWAWALFCLVGSDALFAACFALFLPVYFQNTLWLLPSIGLAALRATSKPFARFGPVFSVALRGALAVAALAAVHGGASSEHDLLVAPLVAAFVCFVAAWTMWWRFDHTNVSYAVLAAVAVHVLQACAMCLAPRAPPLVLWGGPALFYLVLSSSLWSVVAVHVFGIYSGTRTTPAVATKPASA